MTSENLDLSGAVLLNQPAPEEVNQEQFIELLGTLTFVDLIGLAFERAGAELASSENQSAKREYALAKTAAEDAVMRFNRGRSIDLGCFHVADTESPEFLAALNEARKDDPAPATEGAPQ